MWNFFRAGPSCPVGPEERAWVEARFAWLAEQFGAETPKAVRAVLPTPEFFPDHYQGAAEDVWRLLVRVCGYLDLDPSRFRLAFYSEADRREAIGPFGGMTRGTAGQYQGGENPVVWIETSQLDDPPALVATLIHEACHDLLHGAGRLRGDEPDHEHVTDLLTVFLGLGIITANATIRESHWRAGQFSGWRMGAQGYLSQPMYGYALALFARARGEAKPSWLKHLRPDVRVPCSRGLRFLKSLPG